MSADGNNFASHLRPVPDAGASAAPAMPPGADPLAVARQLAQQPPAPRDQPPRVVRAYTGSATLDLRTGLVTHQEMTGMTLRQMMLVALPLRQ